MAVMEAGFKEDMSKEEAIKLAHDAIEAGIVNDLGSGSNVDLMVISRGVNGARHTVENMRNMDTSHGDRKFRKEGGFSFPIGTTDVISTQVFEYGEPVVAMDVSQ